MKYLTILITLLLFQNLYVFAQDSWKASDYKAENYRTVLVLAKISDALAKRQLEDETVKALNTKGIKAIPSYTHLTDADVVNEDVFMARMDSLEVDGLITYTIKGTDTEYKNTPSVGVSVGIPVRVGIFGGYLGTHVPIAGGAKSEQKVNVNAAFFNRSAKTMQWSMALSGKLKNNTSKLAENFSKTTVNSMIKDQIFVR